MMRPVPPLTTRLPLHNGDWVDVKQRLNHGEHQAMLEAMYRASNGGELIREPLKWADAILATYLVDWSVTDLPIRGATRADILAALNLLDQDDYTEIKDAIEAYAGQLATERAEKKRIRIGGAGSLPTSPSLVAVIGGTNG